MFSQILLPLPQKALAMQSNKIHLITASIVVCTMLPGFAQEFNQVIHDQVRNKPVMVDYLSREGLAWGEFEIYYKQEYASYKNDKVIVEKLSESINQFDILIVLATWCIDSKEQVPRFLKVLDEAGYAQEKLLMVGVDSEKKARDIEIDLLNIQRVPTFIVYRDGIEAGRIVETPSASLEADLLQIIKP
jgi:thiol-disulfide isomerase/thioredoxin